MSVKMLIVDDEPIICQGLRSTVPWEQSGAKVVGEAYDGLEALEFINRHSVDLVLTDISMPGMDGLELAQKLKATKPDIRILILSGYEDFEYARQAMRVGVEDYLLKPADVQELIRMVQKISGEIESERKRKKGRTLELAEAWLNRLIQTGAAGVPDSELPPFLDHDQSFRFVASQIEDYALWAEQSTEEERKAEQSNWKLQVNNTLEEMCRATISFFYHPNVLISLCVGSNQIDDGNLKAALTHLHEAAKNSHRLSFSVSETFSAADDFYSRCMASVSGLQYGAAIGEWIVTDYPLPECEKGSADFITAKLENDIMNALFLGDRDILDGLITDMMLHFQESGMLLRDILQIYDELRLVLLRRLRSGGFSLSEPGDFIGMNEIDLHIHNSYRAVEAIIRKELSSLLPVIHDSLAGKNHWVVERAKKYIHSHLNEDIKASEIAAWLKITPNYFSMIFNRHCGKSFAEYLNEVRIELAKSLLTETHDRVFEIADQVGYKEYKYFVSIFKSVTGMTPTQYRQVAEKEMI